MKIWLYLAAYLGAINYLTYVAWRVDKKYAVHGARRISESRLLGLCVLGGWPSALIGTYRFEHKTNKLSFLIKMYALILIEVVAVGGITYLALTDRDALISLIRYVESLNLKSWLTKV
ncbi:DUF1294 domain-containing protein [Asticcacaulis sp. SL142]|uniref:DUF1294 domain-containing protein n=1 Tax=Asticcacaulis sp. SL142 TaxID=2995155 RepID=UPI00226CDA84|nr:DUF1294 domain-containing protein [Asticcacaulis sp. SL142]WAC49711.1 DUF1294 domain-containing protein [Asticcacaulis sp. SL142]